jgi:hypothetical protein
LPCGRCRAVIRRFTWVCQRERFGCGP